MHNILDKRPLSVDVSIWLNHSFSQNVPRDIVGLVKTDKLSGSHCILMVDRSWKSALVLSRVLYTAPPFVSISDVVSWPLTQRQRLGGASIVIISETRTGGKQSIVNMQSEQPFTVCRTAGTEIECNMYIRSIRGQLTYSSVRAPCQNHNITPLCWAQKLGHKRSVRLHSCRNFKRFCLQIILTAGHFSAMVSLMLFRRHHTYNTLLAPLCCLESSLFCRLTAFVNYGFAIRWKTLLDRTRDVSWTYHSWNISLSGLQAVPQVSRRHIKGRLLCMPGKSETKQQ